MITQVPPATQRLMRIIEIISKSGDPNKDFFYLGGPMTGIKAFNFPAFKEAAAMLRLNGYNVVSPAEIDDPETEAAALASVDGAPGSGAANDEPYEFFLERDLTICSMPTCVGGIFLDGWWNSRGALGETWVLEFLNKQLLEIVDYEGVTQLEHFVRAERLRDFGVHEGVPTDPPGVVTARTQDAWVSSPGAVEISADFREEAFI